MHVEGPRKHTRFSQSNDELCCMQMTVHKNILNSFDLHSLGNEFQSICLSRLKYVHYWRMLSYTFSEKKHVLTTSFSVKNSLILKQLIVLWLKIRYALYARITQILLHWVQSVGTLSLERISLMRKLLIQLFVCSSKKCSRS